MIKEAYDAGFAYGVALAQQLIKQAQDYDVYGAQARDTDYADYWARLARMYGLTPEGLYQLQASMAAPEDYYVPTAETYGTAPEAAYSPEQLYGATSSYYPYYY